MVTVTYPSAAAADQRSNHLKEEHVHIASLPTHTLTVTSISEGRDLDWTHPDTCPQPEGACEVVRRIRRMGHDMADLADGRPDGVYRLGGFGFHGLCLVDEDGNRLPDVPVEVEA
jgi:hypothetical protein